MIEAPKKQKDDLEAQAAAAMAELDAMADTNPPTMPPSQHAQGLARQHVELTAQFWSQRSGGEMHTRCGNHEQARAAFEAAKQTLMLLYTVREVAIERGPAVVETFDKIIAAWAAQEQDQRKLVGIDGGKAAK